MKRVHLNLKVVDLAKNITFYTGLFGQPPTVVKPDYAKWLLADPALNFALSLAKTAEIEHLGIQVDEPAELDELFARVDRLEGKKLAEGDTVCCYAKSHKTWVTDPQGVAWEIFRTYGTSETYSEEGTKACC